MLFNIIQNGVSVMTVDTRTEASAKHIARKSGVVGFCTAEKVVRDVSFIPGKEEYRRIREWHNVCCSLAHDDNLADKEAARLMLGAEENPTCGYPAFPCNEAETNSAIKYAHFLGDYEFERGLPL